LTTAGSVAITTYFYDSDDRLLREEISSGPTTTVTVYGYDANGSTTSKTVGATSTFYRWDAENRLVEAKQGASLASATTIASYVYDGNGNRVVKTEPRAQGSKVTTFLVDENQQYAQVLEEREAVGGTGSQVTVAYLYGDDLLNQLRGGQRTYYHYDALGSTRLLTGNQAAITDSYQYEAFGNSTASSGNTPNLYRYTGEQLDTNTGMYYLRARFLDVAIGRFVASDPWAGEIFRPISLNKRIYTENDPVNHTDPSGLIITIAGALVDNFNDLYTRASSAKKAYDVFDRIRTTLCKAPNVIVGRLPKHHALPKFGGGKDFQRLVDLPEEVHIALHQLLHYALIINGFLPPSTRDYKMLFVADRAHRADFLRIVKNVSQFVDKACVGKSPPITPPLRRALRQYGWEF
jgi:RHS repeat-associated protein